MVDHTTLAFGTGGEEHFGDDVGQCRRVAFHSAGERVAAESAEPDVLYHRHLTWRERHAIVVDHDQRSIALDDWLWS